MPAQTFDFIDMFQEWTEGAISPEEFKIWTGVFVVGAALERRCWVRTGNRLTFPNLYLWLVATPGIGKQVIDDGKELFHSFNRRKPTHRLHIAPDSMTTASLVDDLVKSKQVFLPRTGPPMEYHSMACLAEEVAVLLPSYDGDFLGKLNRLYNNPTDYQETRRYGPTPVISIPYPQLSILAGVQPGWMAEVLPETAWTTGLTARTIMIYASQRPYKELFSEHVENNELKQRLLNRIGKLTTLSGEFTISDEAKLKLISWHRSDGKPTPTHSKLQTYNQRRTTLHIIKLSMICAVSSSERLHIELEDVNRAIGLLTKAESVMPDIFRAMVGRSDAQVIEELHYYLTALWRTAGMKPISEEKLWHFLQQRVPSEKIEKILAVAERSNVIARMAGEASYIPRPKTEFDIE